MSDHALLSPSAAHRWLNCPLSARLEAELPEKTSSFAEEGTLAHSVCEVMAKKHFGKIKAASCTRTLKKLKADPLWDDEMLRSAETYVEHLAERAMGFASEPYVAFETSVDISAYVPEAFGRCDCIMFGGDTLVITDFKNGKGVKVCAAENPQLMLYALGAIKLYQPIFGGGILNVEIYIDQPRLGSYESWKCTVEELLAWGEEIKPKAQMAYAGFGEYHAGEWCRFCRAHGRCKAQARQQISAFDDFAPAIKSNLTGLLSPEEMSEALRKGETLVEWFSAVKEAALMRLLEGIPIPGFKIVEGRSSRAWSNQDKALEALEAQGIKRAVIYDSVPKTLAQIEKMLGKQKFDEMVGEFVTKPQGKPTLAPESDKRPVFSSAATDFAAVAENVKSET
ncbi:MAG: DUF2800 domain-containing protein [Selenomonas sp.]|nr:DUF2800 domain-containing protein [Selenomonas sp.]MBP3730961.1 DUF2800 domain-containing protein [Mailhella sp.]